MPYKSTTFFWDTCVSSNQSWLLITAWAILCGFLCRFSEIVCYWLLSEREGLPQSHPAGFVSTCPTALCSSHHQYMFMPHTAIHLCALPHFSAAISLLGYAHIIHGSHLHALPHSATANPCLVTLVVHCGSHIFTGVHSVIFSHPLACFQGAPNLPLCAGFHVDFVCWKPAGSPYLTTYNPLLTMATGTPRIAIVKPCGHIMCFTTTLLSDKNSNPNYLS